MIMSKNLLLEPGDKITSLIYDITVLGHHGEVEQFNAKHLVNGNTYSIPWEDVPYPPCVSAIEIMVQEKLYGAKLIRGMQMADLIDHDKYLEQKEEECE